MRSLIGVAIFAFIAGYYSEQIVFPTDKDTLNYNYNIACFDGQISVFDYFVNKKPLKACEDMGKKRVK